MNVVIVGSGRATRELHLPYFRAMKECNVVALCDPQIEWTTKLAQQFNVPKVYPTLKETLAKEKVDAVSICSIPPKHLDDVTTAFSAGCHVLLEKPMAMNMDEVKKMKAAQEKAGKVFSVVHNYKFTAGIQRTLAMIKEGTIGEVRRIQVLWMKDWRRDRMSSVPDHWSHQLKGGRWGEAIPHMVYILYQMVGKMAVKSVQAKLVNQEHPWLRADEVSVALEHKQGFAEIQLSANMNVNNSDMFVTGSRGSLISTYSSVQPLDTSFSPVKVIGEDIKLAKWALGVVLRRIRRSQIISDSTGHRRIIQGFVGEVLRNTPPLVPWEEAYHTMEIVDKIGEEIDRQVGRAK